MRVAYRLIDLNQVGPVVLFEVFSRAKLQEYVATVFDWSVVWSRFLCIEGRYPNCWAETSQEYAKRGAYAYVSMIQREERKHKARLGFAKKQQHHSRRGKNKITRPL